MTSGHARRSLILYLPSFESGKTEPGSPCLLVFPLLLDAQLRFVHPWRQHSQGGDQWTASSSPKLTINKKR